MTRKRSESGRPPPKPRGELLKIELPFEDALRAALETPPPPKMKTKPKTRR